jgi:ribonuclease HII
MHLAIGELKLIPKFIIVDGNRFKPVENIPHKTIVKGDGKYASIAAASILAKTYRDDFMQLAHNEFSIYNWNKNKGYPTADHRKAIQAHGRCILHRNSFQFKPA